MSIFSSDARNLYFCWVNGKAAGSPSNGKQSSRAANIFYNSTKLEQ